MTTTATTARQFWLWHGIVPTLLFLVLALLGQFSELDVAVSNLLYDSAQGRWRIGNTWLTQNVLHDGGANAIKLVAVLVLLGLAGTLMSSGLRRWRRSFGYAFLCMLLGTGLVSAGKQVSNVDCPWSLEQYGGKRPYIPAFSARPADMPRGVCFPGGHSSGGFSLFFLYFLFRDRNRRLALTGLGVALATGTLFAATQWVRGAHFVSHDIWSAFICWSVALLLYAWAFRCRV
jgi:membrane-associated PAP2 superfamily phosphatase